tara:strand:+ start:956 stop:2332 length:1377 start_codon:yes stop_codon:yes gene_type:complete
VEQKKLVKKIFTEVINPGNCFHCGLCAGLSKNLFKMIDSNSGPIPKLIRKPNKNDTSDLKKIVLACPGRGIPYDFLSKKLITKKKSKIIGNYNSLYIASSNSKVVRQKASSGGLVRSLLIELIKSKKVDYVCILDEKKNKILNFDLLITKNIDQILNSSQSIYQTTPLLHRLKELKKNKKYVFVGLPEHIASLRILKIKYPKDFNHIKFLISIYSGTNMYPGAIEFYLKGNGVSNINEIRKINWRYGEWPGMLRIETKNEKILSLKKFYYNYLIPFFISKNCLITPDFTGELSDISVGDAWSPKLESKGYGYSVAISRSKIFDKILIKLKKKKYLYLKKIDFKNTVRMHAHMIEFKKVGSYLRIEKLKKKGPVPLYDLEPKDISPLRKKIESLIGLIISIASNKKIKFLFSLINSKLMGFIFKIIRQMWKSITKPTKRKGLDNLKILKVKNKRAEEFL